MRWRHLPQLSPLRQRHRIIHPSKTPPQPITPRLSPSNHPPPLGRVLLRRDPLPAGDGPEWAGRPPRAPFPPPRQLPLPVLLRRLRTPTLADPPPPPPAIHPLPWRSKTPPSWRRCKAVLRRLQRHRSFRTNEINRLLKEDRFEIDLHFIKPMMELRQGYFGALFILVN